MQQQNLVHTFKRYQSLYTHRLSVLPVVVLMPHSSCNCKCIMCDIWKDKQGTQLNVDEMKGIVASLKKFQTGRVVFSGGEALLNKHFFEFCEIVKGENIKITLLSNGLTLKKHSSKIVEYVDEVIVSLDGHEDLHDTIRNVKGAYRLLKEGIESIKSIQPGFPVSARCVIQQLNFRHWDKIIIAAQKLQLKSISFLTADVSSEAFNRAEAWEEEKQQSILISKNELEEFRNVILNISEEFKPLFDNQFIAESPGSLMKFYNYYAAHYGVGQFPLNTCNAPWVSAVVEANGDVRPCFFMPVQGNIKSDALETIINNKASIAFRKNLNVSENPVCTRCVCSLNLRPRNNNY